MSVTEARPSVDERMLQAALERANIPTLVPLLFQLTGDSKWLGPTYRPTRAKGTDDHDTGGLTDAVQAEIRSAAGDAVLAWAAGAPAAVPNPEGEQLLALMRLCVAEHVPDEYEAMTAESMGFRPAPAPDLGDQTVDLSVVVIGAGISGLTAAKHLSDMGVSFTVLEKNDRVGGTWIENRYPGCGVDTPSYLYSLSFFPRAWSTHFGKRAELESYLTELAEELDLLGAIRFGSTVHSVTWDETAQVWHVALTDDHGVQQHLTANLVISAVGQLNVPREPHLPGRQDFPGPVFHSARWPEDLDITGKRVAVIGTGASAMQIVPAVVDEVAGLDLYQRSPQWVAPNATYFSAVGDEVHWLMENVPFYRAWYRFRLSWAWNDRIHRSLQKDPDWPHPERSLNAVNDSHRGFFTSYIESELEGRPDLLAKALPDYPPFGKRMLQDNGWFKALRRPHVSLLTTGARALTEHGVVGDDGVERPADVVVLATGFDVERPVRYDVVGRGGVTLRQAWGDDDGRAFLGITAPSFPNLFFMYGPNTNLGHGGSFIFLAEAQIHYITETIAMMSRAGISSLECRTDVHDDYNERLDAAHQKMVWTHEGMDTYYRNSRGRVVSTMPWRVVDYWDMTRTPSLEHFIVRKPA